MKRKALAIGGGLLLALVAAITLINLVKVALGLAVIFFAGRGLMRLWMSGANNPLRGHYFQNQEAYTALGNNRQYSPSQTVQPMNSAIKQQSGIIPIW
jgi:hypothetical protein